VLDPENIDLKTTKIAYESLSEAEQKAMDQALHIANYWDRERELTETECVILDKAGSIMTARIGHLFGEHFATLICGDDKLYQFFFFTRLFWFLDEMVDFIRQRREEDRIYGQKGKTWKQKEKEAKETIYKTWKKPFTTESYEEFMKRIWRETLSHEEAQG
jgi:hypothetical protein